MYNKSVNAITNEKYPIQVDMDILNAAINVLQKNPSKLDQDCMICLTTNPDDADHKFNNCGILNNIEHLRSAFIQSCIAARRALKAQEAAHQSNKMKAINSIESLSESSMPPDSSLPSPKDTAIRQILSTINEGAAEEDFQEGI